MKKFIYVSITTQLKIFDRNNKNRNLQRLYMNIGVDGWSKDDVSRGGFHTLVFLNKRRIAL